MSKELSEPDIFGLIYRIGEKAVIQLVGDPHIADGMPVYAAPPAPQWISVEKEMPPNGEAVMVWCAGCECPGVAWWRGRVRGWIIPEPQAIGAESISHWSPLPPPPQ